MSTRKTPLTIESISPAILEMERMALWAVSNLGMDVLTGKTTFVVQTRGKKSVCGWYRNEGWSTKEGDKVNEVTVAAEYLKESAEDITETIIHEMVHQWLHELGEKGGCSKSGRHNKRFKEYAEIVGLVVGDPDKSKGYHLTSLSDELKKQVSKDLVPDASAFTIFKEEVTSTPKAPSKSKKWVCQCPDNNSIRSGRPELDITCNLCDEKFTLED